MRKHQTPYRIKKTNKTLTVFKDGKVVAQTTNQKIEHALEAVFVLEGKNLDDWFIEEDEFVFRVNRNECNISKDEENLQV